MFGTRQATPAEIGQQRPPAATLWQLPGPISEDEFEKAQLAPPCIVEDYLFADVAVRVAPGGTGKTTLTLYESIHIVLGRRLFGMEVLKPGPVLILSAEDRREMLVARLRALADALQLGGFEREVIRRDIRISDLTGEALKLTIIVDDVVMPGPAVDDIIANARPLAPVVIEFDPAISFGVGEARTNDAEQGLIEAARRIRRELECCVRFTHHSGKNNAREKATDQYATRGGSALSDGARMVSILHPLAGDEWAKAAGSPLLTGETGMLLARPKLSYRPPAPDLLISRKGYAFACVTRFEQSKAEQLEGSCAQILRAIEHDVALGRYPTKHSLEALGLGRTRAEVRDAVEMLLSRQQIEHVPVPGNPQRGARTFLRPVGSPESRAPLGEAISK
ncbi:MAG TPA: AAA family ATPase [Casimicrobiaceae bacterium]|nr:AAA family ATPase [Casimicrobiaceae bacterium]